jgi:hypothetical protein
VFCEEVELPLGFVEPADWLEGAELPLAGEFCEFCVEVPCAGAVCACGAGVDAGGLFWLCAGGVVPELAGGVVGDCPKAAVATTKVIAVVIKKRVFMFRSCVGAVSSCGHINREGYGEVPHFGKNR